VGSDIRNTPSEKEELAADGSKSGVEAEAEGHVPFPYNSDKISISSQTIPISTIVRRLGRGLIVAAEMQRGEDLWDIGKKSRLIESILLKIPLPLFYVAERTDGKLSIVDGLQRIGTIRSYVAQNSFRLKELEFLKELEGKRYNDLDDDLQIRVEETPLQFVIISPDSPPEVQRNIFKRLNTGGLPLSDQEIRHALYYGPVAGFLNELANTPEFIYATTGSVDNSRLAAHELILRFLSFAIMGVEAYSKDDDMDEFLCDTMQIINTILSGKTVANGEKFRQRMIKCADIESLRKRFLLAMERAHLLFDNCAFRMSVHSKLEQGKPRKPINKSLFEAWSIILSDLDDNVFDDLVDCKDHMDDLLETVYDNAHPNRRFYGTDSLKVRGVKGRHEMINKIILDVLERNVQ